VGLSSESRSRGTVEAGRRSGASSEATGFKSLMLRLVYLEWDSTGLTGSS
jgi:hypothetical protein